MTQPADSAASPPGSAAARRMAYEELLLSPVGALTRYRDADGRPLCGEALIDDPEFRASLELRRCPYVGSRKHHELPMNVSALKQMTKSWDDALGTARLLGKLLTNGAASGGGGDDEPRGTLHLMRVAYACVCLPLFLLYREEEPMPDRGVPGFVSGLHKASIDIATGAQLLLVLSYSGEPWPGTLHQFIEHHKLLIGSIGVCAGPPHMIDEIAAVMANEPNAPATKAAELADAERMLGDLRGVVGYADAVMEIVVIRHLLGAYVRRRIDQLVKDTSQLIAAEPARAEESGVRALQARLVETIARHPVPTRPSEIIQRQDQVIRQLPPAAYEALLDSVEAGHRALSTFSVAGSELLAHARRSKADPDDIPRVVKLVGDRLELEAALRDAPAAEAWLTAVAEALVDTATLEHLALDAIAEVEYAIVRSLGGRALGGAASSHWMDGDRVPRLASEDLGRVIGVSPVRYLGELLGVDVEVSSEQITYSRRREGSRAEANHSHLG